ncbi:hypothetical protein K4K49_012606 [Colletotrichum sp. SAR 10_70]|nr:hypothetical protein K4K50_009717 [Colletotrichum sp. SAR 10_71]KAI8176131.1 hypothetical protein K4K51_006812 [Colletotrichum sp. SAR 10_75]KAI8189070.1 hypothetical protein K4K49_012606 [Colletotrichum sp. SAR 10_70]KAI8225923.1 hypothetical protein K4K53_006325 [Colletotrichum sp. SAR 10_77]
MTGPSNAYIGHGPVTLISEDVADVPMNPSACLTQGQPDLPYRWEVEEHNRTISPNSIIPQSVADAFNAQNYMYQQMPILLPQEPFERYSENDNGAAIFAVEFESLFDAETNLEKRLQILHIACVIRYRRHDGYRLFPPEDFYEYLLQNEPDRDETTPIATRCAKWFHSMTPSDADLRIDELLELRKSLTTPSPPDLRHVNFPKQTAPASKGKAKASEITDHQHPLIAREMAKPATMGYHNLIRSMEHFDELEEAYDNHIRKDVLESPTETDVTWPVSQEMQYGYIGQAFAAIFDTASFVEKTAALAKQARIDENNAVTQEMPVECNTGPSKKRKLDHGASHSLKRLEKLNTAEAVLADPNSTPRQQLKAIIHYELTDFEAELRQAQKQQEGFTMKAPWGGKTARVWERYDSFEERWNRICLMLKTNKQLLKSLIQVDWFARTASAPLTELKAKASNRVLNAKRDEESRVGRRVIKSSKTCVAEQGDEHLN